MKKSVRGVVLKGGKCGVRKYIAEKRGDCFKNSGILSKFNLQALYFKFSRSKTPSYSIIQFLKQFSNHCHFSSLYCSIQNFAYSHIENSENCISKCSRCDSEPMILYIFLYRVLIAIPIISINKMLNNAKNF